MRQVYMAAYTAPGGGLDVLEELLEGRQELAGLLGAPSWSQYQVLTWLQDGTTCPQCRAIMRSSCDCFLKARVIQWSGASYN